MDANNIAMVILVKNEADIIELNVRFHAQLGIKQFLVMDNGSSDGTLEILHALADEPDIDLKVIENPAGVYQQSKWMTDLARQAKKVFGVTHVIPNDADEFWWPSIGQDLPGAVNEGASVQTVHRVNRLLTRQLLDENTPFFSSEYFAHSPVLYSGDKQQHDDRCSMQIVKISPKVIVQTKGLIKIKGGNHRADHWKVWKKVKNSEITVHHFPIRSLAQFSANVVNRDMLLDKPKVKMGPHYRRWVRQYRADKLEAEFNHLSLSNEQLKVLYEIGVVDRDEKLPKIFEMLVAQICYRHLVKQ